MTRAEIAALAKRALKSDAAKSQVNAIVRQGFAKDGKNCIRADDPEFAKFGAFSFSDIGVILRYEEDLIYSCERWKQ